MRGPQQSPAPNVKNAMSERGADRTLQAGSTRDYLVAIFHSHTHSPAVPSPTDHRTALYRDPFYVLATLTDPVAAVEAALRAWRIENGTSREVPLRIE